MLEKIKALCADRGLSIAALEKKAGIGNGTIAHWDESKPNLASLEKAAAALGVTVSALIGGGK